MTRLFILVFLHLYLILSITDAQVTMQPIDTKDFPEMYMCQESCNYDCERADPARYAGLFKCVKKIHVWDFYRCVCAYYEQ